MGFTLFSIAIGSVSLILVFLLPINYAEWFTWVTYVIISIFFFVKSFTEYNSLSKGAPKSVTDIMGMASFPFTTSFMMVVLVIFLFIDVNKLHLLWLYSIVALFFDFTVGKKAGQRVLKAKGAYFPECGQNDFVGADNAYLEKYHNKLKELWRSEISSKDNLLTWITGLSCGVLLFIFTQKEQLTNTEKMVKWPGTMFFFAVISAILFKIFIRVSSGSVNSKHKQQTVMSNFIGHKLLDIFYWLTIGLFVLGFVCTWGWVFVG